MNLKRFFGVSVLVFLTCLSQVALATEAPLPKMTLISNVNIFDGKADKLHEGMYVLISDNLIETISAEPLAVIQTDNVTMIDGGGRTLMPGLIDAHWHVMYNKTPVPVLANSENAYVTLIGAKGAGETLLRGFTTVRDIGGNPFAVKKAVDEGLIPGPRIYPSGPAISQLSGHSDFQASLGP